MFFFELINNKFRKQERQSLLDSSLIQLPKSIQQSNESLFMTSSEKARLRNESILKVKDLFEILIDQSLCIVN